MLWYQITNIDRGGRTRKTARQKRIAQISVLCAEQSDPTTKAGLRCSSFQNLLTFQPLIIDRGNGIPWQKKVFSVNPSNQTTNQQPSHTMTAQPTRVGSRCWPSSDHRSTFSGQVPSAGRSPHADMSQSLPPISNLLGKPS